MQIGMVFRTRETETPLSTFVTVDSGALCDMHTDSDNPPTLVSQRQVKV